MPTPEKTQVSEPIDGPAGKPGDDFPIVAVGASAGGLEAFTELLRDLPADTGMAFVFIQHLSPDHESMLPQLLSRETAMPVTQVRDGTVVLPNHVHVIPPNAAMTLTGTVLVLRPRETAATAVDTFLRSLAVSRQDRAVAVILSGTGSDGALGVQAIAEEGGVVIAQDPASARFDGMPRGAIATGCVDLVLQPEGIAAELARIAREPRLVHGEVPEIEQYFSGSETDYRAVLDLLREVTGIDFNLYRQTTVRRRVLRRLGLLKQENLGQYVRYARENPDEAQALAQDILIRVTRFFRDPEVFEVLNRRVFPALIRRTPPDHAVRIWAPGCSTGEDAYSLAICFTETAEQMQSHVPLQLFATDINEAAIQRARRGAYIGNIAADVSPERLARFFVGIGKEFQVSRRLRDLCIFSRHDLLHDPPFSRMGLVSCRNVLMYLDAVQEQALAKFHFALNPGGFLLLGRSESATSSSEWFTPLDREARLYVRQDSATRPAPGHARRRDPVIALSPPAVGTPEKSPQRTIDLRAQADRIVLERYGPQRVIVDVSLEPAGPGDTPIDAECLRMLEAVRASAAEALRDAVSTAVTTGRPARIEGLRAGEGPRRIDIEVTPLGTDGRHALVAFEESADSGTGAAEHGLTDETRKLEARIRDLQRQVASSRARMESVIVEQEAANEEVIAANEELQSLNEELESSKEELEAANEELITVNEELKLRNMELEVAREFAQTTIDTVRGALVVLGPDLRVIKANVAFYRTFLVSPQDVEHRFIYEVGRGRFDNPRLRVLLEEVLPARHAMEDFEMEHDSPGAGRRTLLMNARRFEHEERILLAIEDVTERRRNEEELRQSQKMEAIGYLAAGVAHDFNNLLTGVIGNASLLLDAFPEGHVNRSVILDVIDGGERAAELTRQLLAYAGKGRFYLERVNLSQVVIQTSRLIHPSITPNVQVRLDLDKEPPLLLADPSQIQQVVMNLVINAVEALRDTGGMVQVRTGRQTVTGEPLPDVFPNQMVFPGQYLFLEVQDNGPGMDEQTVSRIFDPFFTTKFTGRGLGLAAVMGIVRQQEGVVQVHSVPGRGTSFRVLFPITKEAPAQAGEEPTMKELQGAGTVLVVDDDELIRDFARSALRAYGYNALVAVDGREAIRIFTARAGDIALVLLDDAMPGINGPETLERLRRIRPDVRVIVCSGYDETEVQRRFTGTAIDAVFPKPYTARQLARMVKDHMTPDVAPGDDKTRGADRASS